MKIEAGFLERDDYNQLKELDAELFDVDYEFDISKHLQRYDLNKYQWIIAKDECGKLLGYISFWHITDDAYKLFLDGKMKEDEFKIEHVVPFGKQKEIYCHLCAFVVRDKNTRVASRLINECIRYFEFLKGHGIFVKKVTTIPTSEQGYTLCKKLTFKKVKELEYEYGVTSSIYVKDILTDETSTRLLRTVKGIFLEKDEAI